MCVIDIDIMHGSVDVITEPTKFFIADDIYELHFCCCFLLLYCVIFVLLQRATIIRVLGANAAIWVARHQTWNATAIPEGRDWDVKQVWILASLESLDVKNPWIITAASNVMSEVTLYTNELNGRWLSSRLQYLRCLRTGDTAVLHQAIDVDAVTWW